MLVTSIEVLLMLAKADKRFRANLVRLMKEHNMSGSDLARMMKVNPTVISRWINGKNTPSLSSIDFICESTGWDASEFLLPIEGETPPPKNERGPAEVHRSVSVINDFVQDHIGERPKLKKKSSKKAN